MARRPYFSRVLQTRLTEADYQALKEAFPPDYNDSEVAREAITEWLAFRKRWER